MKQLIAGSVIDNLYDVFEKIHQKRNAVQKNLGKWLSHFHFIK